MNNGMSCAVCGSFIPRDEVFYLRPDWRNYANPIGAEVFPVECFQCYRCERIERLATLVDLPPGVGLLQLRLDGL